MRHSHEALDQVHDLKADVEDLENRLQKSFADITECRDKL